MKIHEQAARLAGPAGRRRARRDDPTLRGDAILRGDAPLRGDATAARIVSTLSDGRLRLTVADVTRAILGLLLVGD